MEKNFHMSPTCVFDIRPPPTPLRGSAAKNLQNRLYECPWGSSDLDETLYLELYSWKNEALKILASKKFSFPRYARVVFYPRASFREIQKTQKM